MHFAIFVGMLMSKINKQANFWVSIAFYSGVQLVLTRAFVQSVIKTIMAIVSEVRLKVY